MANILDLVIGSIVSINTDHPIGSNANVAGHIGVITNIHLEYDNDKKASYAIYSVKDRCDGNETYRFHATELEIPEDMEIKYWFKNMVLRTP